jgi:hypothetical protein
MEIKYKKRIFKFQLEICQLWKQINAPKRKNLKIKYYISNIKVAILIFLVDC